MEPTTAHRPPPDPVVIVGASTAGLATAAWLKRRQIPYVLLEKQPHVGDAWRHHYERLHLHTNKGSSNLPFLAFAKGVPKYPAREQVVAYLEQYVQALGLEPRFNQEVRLIERAGEGFVVHTEEEALAAQGVVVATGYTRVPYLPSWPGLDAFPGPVLHTSAYRNGEPYRGQRVLVVGFGNSACEIALCLHEHGAQPTLAVKGAVNIIPRDVFGIPVLTLGILSSHLPPRVADKLNAPLLHLLVGDFTGTGLRKLPYGPIEQITHDGRIPLLDIGTLGLIREGKIQVRRGIPRFEGATVVFDDGVKEAFDAVVLGTGYRPALDGLLARLPGLLDGKGHPLAPAGKSPIPGLYFCGFHVSPGGMIREAGQEAKRISGWIAAGQREASAKERSPGSTRARVVRPRFGS